MKTNITLHKISNDYLDVLNQKESTLFFDIETTGFSRQTAIVYMIGYGYIKHNYFHLTQLLIENEHDEKEILSTFFLVASSFDCLFTFNGLQFDLPFLIERGRIHHLSGSFLKRKTQIDLFREMKSLRHVLSLENAKQKTFEQFLNIRRNDEYDGGQLIPVFFQYLAHPSVETEQLLWTHNLEDVMGMYHLLPLLYYKKMLNPDELAHTTYKYLPLSNELFITQEMDIFICSPISYRFKHYYLSIENNKRKLLISLSNKEYYLPLEPINDYIYVKSEDMVIPKALATTMDKGNYSKATKKNCFLRIQANCFGLNLKNNNRFSTFSLTPLKVEEKNDPYTYISLAELLAQPEEQHFKAIFSSILEEIIRNK